MKKTLSIALLALGLFVSSCQNQKAAEEAAAAAAKATADSIAAAQAVADSLAKIAAMADTMKADTSHAGHSH
jgi:PBP1b-binding outer membrane lipoprotein LpoB